MAINPLSIGAGSLSPAQTAAQAAAQQPATTAPAAQSDALLAALDATNAGQSTDPFLSTASQSSDPLLSDLTTQDATDQSLGTLFSTITGATTSTTDPSTQDDAFFSSQLSVPIPAQQALNAYVTGSSATGSSAGQSINGQA